jgi:hypothetical protein
MLSKTRADGAGFESFHDKHLAATPKIETGIKPGTSQHSSSQ